MALAVIGLGSNVGDALSHLQSAVDVLRDLLNDLKVSGVYRTAPMYVTDQPYFLNAIAVGQTNTGPYPLLRDLKDLERQLGRNVRERFGPREIDLDLVAYGNLVYRLEDVLHVPHPKVAERRFVLEPLCELLPERYLPGIGRIAALLEQTKDAASDVVRLDDAVLSVRGQR